MDPLINPDLPQEIQDEIKQRHRLAVMESEEQMHDLLAALVSLDDAQIKVLQKLFQAIVSAEGSIVSNYYSGFLSALLQGRGICSHCGTKHGFDEHPAGKAAPAGKPVAGTVESDAAYQLPQGFWDFGGAFGG